MNPARAACRIARSASSALPLASSSRLPSTQVVSFSGPATSQSRAYNPFDSLSRFLLSPKQQKKKQADSAAAAPSTPKTESSSSTDVATTSGETKVAVGEGDLFDQVQVEREQSGADKVHHKEHKYSTASFKQSPRKLNQLANQISGRPIDDAILQMQFSERRVGKTRIKSTLVLARQHALDKGLDGGRLVVAESWVSKGRFIKRIDIKGRARHGIKHHPSARLHVVLREGKTKAQEIEERRKAVWKAVRSSGVVREERKLINVETGGWKW